MTTLSISSARSTDGRIAAALAAFTAAVCLATWPFVEIGVSDDCSYYRTALLLARTGRFEYNGWATAMLGAQAWYGALIVRLFGFSFTGLRLAMLPFAAGAAALLYAIGRRTGLPRRSACLLTLAVVFSPVFIPLAVSYMTDIFGFFLLLLALYAALRAAAAEGARTAALWLVLTALASATGATVRQPNALLALISIPYVLWLRRGRPGRRPLAIAGAGLWCATVAAVAATGRWFAAQPYAIHDDGRKAFLALLRTVPTRHFLWMIATGVLTPCVLLLPLTLFTLPIAWRRGVQGRARLVVPALVIVALLLVTLALLRRPGRDWWPYWADIFSWHDFWTIDYNGEPDDTPAAILPRAVRYLLLTASFATLLYAAAFWLRGIAAAARKEPSERRPGAWIAALPPALPILTIHAVIYLALVLVWSETPGGVLLDRYWIPLLPLLGMLALRCHHRSAGEDARVPAGCWALVGLYGIYAMAGAHDHLAIAGARLQGAETLARAGVPRTEMCVTFPYDAWTQFEAEGHLNERRVTYPPDGYRHYRPAIADLGVYWYAERTPALHPRWFVRLHLSEDLQNTAYPPTRIRTWLPPYDRTIYIQKLPADFGAPDRPSDDPPEQDSQVGEGQDDEDDW